MVISDTPGSGMIRHRLKCTSKRDENQNTRRKEAVHYTRQTHGLEAQGGGTSRQSEAGGGLEPADTAR